MTSSDTLQYYARHDALTHPAGFAPLYDALPAGASALCRVMSGLMVHTSWADKYGIPSGTPLAVCNRLSAAAAAAVKSGSVRIVEELAKSHLTPPWQRGPEASQRVTVAR
jgi:hypothetical protein